MKKIKLIPFIISILFPLACTTFIVCYSYGVNDTYTKNKDRYEVHVQQNYYDENGQASDEIKKAVTMDSNKYQLVSLNNLEENFSGDLNSALYAYTSNVETTNDEGETETSLEIAYSLYLYDIVYNNKYSNSSAFESQNGVYLKNGASLALVYVKGTGAAPDERLDIALDELKENGITSTGTYVTASKVDINDTNAQNYTSTDDTEAMTYRVSLFNSLTADFFNFDDLEKIYEKDIEDGQVIEEGYTLALVNYYSTGAHSNSVKVISKFTIDNVYEAEDFEELETVSTGYSSDYAKAGYSYLKFVFPTLLWQGALTLVITGILSVLFYAIWQVEEVETEEQKRIKKLQANKKQVKKANKK